MVCGRLPSPWHPAVPPTRRTHTPAEVVPALCSRPLPARAWPGLVSSRRAAGRPWWGREPPTPGRLAQRRGRRVTWSRVAVGPRRMAGFRSRSFENNWNIYKLLAHQKVSKEKVRCEGGHLGLQGQPRGWGLPGVGLCLLQPPQDAGSSEQVQLGRDCLLRGFCIVSRGRGSASTWPAGPRQPASVWAGRLWRQLARQTVWDIESGSRFHSRVKGSDLCEPSCEPSQDD